MAEKSKVLPLARMTLAEPRHATRTSLPIAAAARGSRQDGPETAGMPTPKKAARFVILACNIGKDSPPAGKQGFLDRLASILGVEVVAYRGRVAIGEVVFTNPGVPANTKEQIWIATDETDVNRGRPSQDDPDHASFHDVPLTARVTAAAPSPTP